MNRSIQLFAGVIGSFALSAYALVLLPQKQIGALDPQFVEEDGKVVDQYPIQNQGIVEKGREVYAANGCFYCHSQQVRDEQNGLDIERGWGVRRTVARDYIFEQPAYLGSTRFAGFTVSPSGSLRHLAEPTFARSGPKRVLPR